MGGGVPGPSELPLQLRSRDSPTDGLFWQWPLSGSPCSSTPPPLHRSVILISQTVLGSQVVCWVDSSDASTDQCPATVLTSCTLSACASVLGRKHWHCTSQLRTHPCSARCCPRPVSWASCRRRPGWGSPCCGAWSTAAHTAAPAGRAQDDVEQLAQVLLSMARAVTLPVWLLGQELSACNITAAAHHNQRGALGHEQAPLVLLLGRRKWRHALQGAGSKQLSASTLSDVQDSHGVLETARVWRTNLQCTLLQQAHRNAELLAASREVPQRAAYLQESGAHHVGHQLMRWY